MSRKRKKDLALAKEIDIKLAEERAHTRLEQEARQASRLQQEAVVARNRQEEAMEQRARTAEARADRILALLEKVLEIVHEAVKRGAKLPAWLLMLAPIGALLMATLLRPGDLL